MGRWRLPQAYSAPTPVGRVSTLIPEVWSIAWMGWWVVSMIAGANLFRGPSWALLAHLPQPAWALVCAGLTLLHAASLYRPRLHRTAVAASGVFWLAVASGFLLATPFTTGVGPYLTVGLTLVYCAVEARPT